MSAQPAAKPPLAILPLLAAAAFASGCGARMLDPLLPLLARDFHVTVAETAVVISAFTLPYGLSQIVLGPLGDRFGKLRVLVLGLLLYGLAMAACATAGALDRLVLLRALSGGLGGAIIPLAMAWIGDNVPYSERQATLGRFLTGMVMAQLLAGPIAGSVGQLLGWEAVFLLVGVLAVLMAFGIMATLGRGLWRPVPSPAGGSGFSRYITLLKRPAGRLLLIAAFLDGMLLFGGAFPFIGSYLIQIFHLEPWQAGLVVAVFGLGSFAYTRLARRLVNGLGEGRVLLLGGLVLAVGLAGLSIVTTWWGVALCQVLLGLAFFMYHGTLQARSTEVMPEARATAVSAFAMALFLGQGLGSVGFGITLAQLGYPGAFLLAGVGMAALAVWTRVAVLAPR
ncbi:MFS transporter [Roseomonas aerophila]|uniref:MFS transporter n=1 Tax=Teichococcus aerophilus TaxID=1224513 RepID=A0ABR7RQ27_9PROT|nr:MFS transporter [Pseudoroseomonas aerophila]